jgi:hypothetical protein
MKQSSFDVLRSAMSGYMQTSILAAVAELDFCTVILANGNSLSASGLAAGLKCDLRGMAVVLDALTAMGFLNKSGMSEDARYSVAREYTAVLDSRIISTIDIF